MRISATLIDQFLRYQRDEYAKESELIASIKGEFIPTRPVLCGQSFEKIMESPDRYRTVEGFSCDGLAWPKDEIEECLTQFTTPGTWQVKEVRSYIIDGITVNIVAKVDRLVGDAIEEVKTRWSAFDFEKYYHAHQWRHYLLNFGASRVRYKVFCWADNKGGFKLNGVEVFDLYPYEGMEADCLATVGDLVDYIRLKNLESFVADNRWTVVA